MLIRKEFIGQGCMLGIWKMVETCEELFAMLSTECQHEASEYLSKVKSNQRRLEWLSSRVVLQNLTDDNKVIRYTPTGRPYLLDKSYNISISHSKDYVAVLLHRSKRVGIDIENYSNRILKVETRFISDIEYIDPTNRILHLILHWCAKETLFKLLDYSDVSFKEHLHILPFEIKNRGLITAKESFTAKNDSYNINYEVNNHYIITWGVL